MKKYLVWAGIAAAAYYFGRKSQRADLTSGGRYVFLRTAPTESDSLSNAQQGA